MQINIANSGPTMAASEPPEPPPRNPERINATLHKLAESVSTLIDPHLPPLQQPPALHSPT